MSVRAKGIREGVWILALLGCVVIGARPSEAAQLTFEDVALGPDGIASVFGLYEDPSSNFNLVGTFQARGAGAPSALTPETSSGSGTVSTSLASFSGGVSVLFDPAGTPFTLLSIDLAREFEFNVPASGVDYPQVTFEGLTTAGSLVSQTFVVDQAGFFFQTFSFSDDFTDLIWVSWNQPLSSVVNPDSGLLLGLHQFDNIRFEAAATTPVPEPATLSLLAIGSAMAARGGRRFLVRRKEEEGRATDHRPPTTDHRPPVRRVNGEPRPESRRGRASGVQRRRRAVLHSRDAAVDSDVAGRPH